MIKIQIAAVLLVSLLFAGQASAFTDYNFCNTYGVACFRDLPEQDKGFFMRNLLDVKKEYIGSIHLADGMQCSTFLSCTPANEKYATFDFTATCNERFPECDGKCYANPDSGY